MTTLLIDDPKNIIVTETATNTVALITPGPQGATAPGCPTFIQSTQPTLGELNGFTTYAWWDTSQTDLTLWIEDGD